MAGRGKRTGRLCVEVGDGRKWVRHRNPDPDARERSHDELAQPPRRAATRQAQGRGDRVRLRRTLRHQGAEGRRRRHHDDRDDDAPPVPAAALPGGDRHPLRGRDRAADAGDPVQAEERQRDPRRGPGHRRRGPDRDLARAEPDHRDAVRHADRRGRRGSVLLRQRPVRRVRTRHEEHRRRPRAARPDLRRLRAGRDRRDRRGDRPAADLRRRRGRPHRGGDGRADRRAGAPHPARTTSGGSTPATPG